MKLAAKHGIALDPEDWPAIWNVLKQYQEPVYVYAIVDAEGKYVKFGKSVNPGARLHSLQTANGLRLKLWAFCEETDYITEKGVHKEMKKHRIGGEWFRLNDETRKMIERIRRMAQADASPYRNQ